MDGQQQIGDPIEKLYNVVKGKGYYTKSLNEFKTQYSTPEQIDKIYNVVSGDKLYTKSKQDFYNQYFPAPEKKSKVGGASPIVSSGDGRKSQDDEMAKYALPVSADQQKYFEEDKRRREALESPKVKLTEEEITSDPVSSYKKVTLSKVKERTIPQSIVSSTAVQKPLGARLDKPVEEVREGISYKDARKDMDKAENYYRQNTDVSLNHLSSLTGIAPEQLYDDANADAIVSKLRPGNETDRIAVEALDNAKTARVITQDGGDFQTQAIRLRASKKPEFAEQMQKLGDPKQHLKSVTLGELEFEYFNDPAIEQEVKRTPQLYSEYKQEKYNLFNRRPEFGRRYFGNILAQKMEDMGINNGVLNVVTQDELEKVSSSLLEEGKISLQDKSFIDREIKPRMGLRNFANAIIGDALVPTTGVVENVAEGVYSGLKGLAVDLPSSLAKDIRTTTGLSEGKTYLAEAIEKQAKQTGVRPSSFIHEMTQFGGNILGQSVSVGYGGKILQGIGAAKNLDTAIRLSGALQAYGMYDDEARRKFDNPLKQIAFKGIMSAMFYKTEGIFNDRKVVESIMRKMKPEVAQTIKEFTSKRISEEAIKYQLSGALAKALREVPGYAKYGGRAIKQNVAEEVAQDISEQSITGVFEGKPINEIIDAERVVNTGRQAMFGSVFIGAIAARADMKSNRGITAKTIYEMAQDADQWKEQMTEEAKLDKDLEAELPDKIANLDYAAKVLKDLEGTDMTEKAKVKYLMTSLDNRVREKKAEGITDKTLAKKESEAIKANEAIQEALLNGKDDGSFEGDKNDEGEDVIELTPQEQEAIDGLQTGDFEGTGIKTWTNIIQNPEASPNSKRKALQELYEQLNAKGTEATVGTALGKKADLIYDLNYEKPVESEALRQLTERPSTPMQDQEGATEDVVPSTLKDENNPFKESKVPQVVYRASTGGKFGEGKAVHFTSNKKYAESYAEDMKGNKIGEVKAHYVDLRNPLVVSMQKDYKELANGKMIENAKKEGYDGIIAKDETGGVDEIVVFDSSKIQQQSTPTKEGKPKVRVTADELEAAQPKQNEKTETTGIPDQTKTTSEQPTEPNKAGSEAGESQEMRLAHADTERIYQEAGLPLRLETPTKHRAELEKEADEILQRGYDFNRVAEETMDGTRKWEDTDQVLFARKVADLIAKQNRTDIQSPEFDRLQSEIEKLSRASDLAGTIGARFLESRKGYRPVEESISDFVTIEKESAGVDELTPTQKENLKKEYDDLHQAKADFEAYKAKKEAEFATKQAESKVSEVKATAKKTKKTHEDFVKERKDIVADMKEKLRKARGDTSVTIVPYAKELFAIAPDVAKLTKSLVEEGVSKLEDIVKEIHATISQDIPEVTEIDVRDIIAGEYNEKKKTRNQLAANMFELKREAKLVNQLDALFKDPEPKTEKARIEKNKRVADLKKQIKDIQSFEKEVATQKEEKLKQSAKEAEATGKVLDKAEKDIAAAEEKERKQKHAEAERERKQLERQFEQEKRAEEKAKIKLAIQEAKRIEKELSYRTPEEKALDRMKATIQKNLEKIEGQIKSGDFSKEEKKQPIKLDKEGHELRDKLMKLQQARDVRILLQQRQQEGKGDRIKRWVAEVGNVPRTLMTIADFSALLRQNIFFSAGHPLRTAAAVPGMFKSFVSQTVYDRWFADLKDSPRYEIIKDSKLAIADSLSHDLSKREEDFMSSLAEKIPIIGRTLNVGKVKVPGLNIVKGSERSYTMLLNKMRVDMFNFFAESLEKRGITYENSPEVYKATAEYINNATGRSDFGKTLNKVAPVLNTAFFSPRLIASRVNMLTYWAQPRFWKTLPKEARIDYFRNWASLLAVGGTILGLASLAGADVEEDPRSSDFGKIKDGDTRWDIWGGAQPYIRVFAQVASGKGKSSTTGGIYTMSQKERWLGKPGSFLRNKLAPVPGAVFDLLSGETGIGEKIVYEWGGETNGKEISIDQYVKERLLPMTITGTAEAMKDQGVKGLFTVGIPNVFGVGTQTYGSSPTTTNQRQSKPKRTRDRKPTKSD